METPAAEPLGAAQKGNSPSRWKVSSWKLRTKLSVLTLLLLTAICSALGILGYAAVNVILTQQLDRELHEASNRTIRFGDPIPRRTSQVERDALPNQGAGTLSAYRSDGEVYFSALYSIDEEHEDLPPADIPIINSLPESSEPAERLLSVGRYRLIAVDDTEGDILITGLPTADRDATLNSLASAMAGISLAGLIVTGLSAAFVIRRTLRPLDNLSKVATNVAELPLDVGEVVLAARVTSGSPQTEVGNMGHAFNKMLDHVASALNARQRSETQVRQFVADASHELRTPLAAIRGHSELIRMTEHLGPKGDASLRRVESETQRMTTLVEDLLLLAWLDEGHSAVDEDVDITELIIEAVSDIRITAPEQQWSVHLPEEPVVIRGNANHLRQVLINLLSNAHKHTSPGTTVVTSVTMENDQIRLTVTDDGPGIPPEFLDHVFSRFTRADKARTGGHATSGLGLSIVDAIVRAHQGQITVHSEPGSTSFTVRLPKGTNSAHPRSISPDASSTRGA
ncbi:HAMP domain-containing protein [Arthrobacter sp. JZ12]|uniref:sensor histidine kinase n=1 Tax=Arthrobacter sp. JZ12 TaxID=2654190 RepID=UPI002B4A7A7B|nr:HAMP domain-containing sensor histidine kinase [Arthrobacter sp. JZ12]WRH25973.1 HAMP domain-containing protein [Arthrobacter sp. JZ12]